MFLSLKLRDPIDQPQESKAAPARKVKRVSGGVSEGSRPTDPRKRVKNESPRDSAESKITRNSICSGRSALGHADLEEKRT